MNIESPQNGIFAAGGGGYGPPPGGYGPPGGAPGGYGPPGAPGGYGPPGAPGGMGMPPGGAPMAPPGGGPMMGMPGGANPELKKQTQTWLIIAIASFFLCGNTCFGVIGAILAYLAGQSADQGNVADAQGKLKWAKIVTIGGVIFVVLAVIAYLIFFFLVMGGSAMM